MLVSLHQLTGCTVILMFCVDIFSKMKAEGKFPIPIPIAACAASFINLIANFASPPAQAKLGQKKTLAIGMMMQAVCHMGVIIFYTYDIPIGVLCSILLFLISYQASLGPIAFLHVIETCHTSKVGFLNLTLFAVSISYNFIASAIQ